MIGIYKITNLKTEKIYVGSSINIEQRWNKHKALLRHNKHENIKLQNSWNKHGEDNFEFSVIEECVENELIQKEQYYLDTLLFAQEFIKGFNKKFYEFGYNLTPSCINNYFTKETLEKISDTLKTKYKLGLLNKSNTKKCYQYNRFTGELIKFGNVLMMHVDIIIHLIKQLVKYIDLYGKKPKQYLILFGLMNP